MALLLVRCVSVASVLMRVQYFGPGDPSTGIGLTDVHSRYADCLVRIDR